MRCPCFGPPIVRNLKNPKVQTPKKSQPPNPRRITSICTLEFGFCLEFGRLAFLRRRGFSFGILVAGASFLRRLDAMGAKYLPSIKDLKANQRFLQQQRPLPKFAKPAAGPTGKRAKKK
jgi:hypothetical protein